MKQLVKRFLYSAAPQWTTAIQSARARAHSHRLYQSWGCTALNSKLLKQLGNRVVEGPFAGLVLSPMTEAEHLGPFLLGVYESELDPGWQIVFNGKYSQVVDVGAKFGFYAVGLALRYRDIPVWAFDTDEWARRAVVEMAAVNGTPNLKIQGFCSPEWLKTNSGEADFIISDCEGYEDVLFNDSVLLSLASATLIIETHDNFVPGVSERLRSAFSATHIVRVLGAEHSVRESTQALNFLDDKERALAHNEFRSNQVWLLCLPRKGPNGHLGE